MSENAKRYKECMKAKEYQEAGDLMEEELDAIEDRLNIEKNKFYY